MVVGMVWRLERDKMGMGGWGCGEVAGELEAGIGAGDEVVLLEVHIFYWD